MKPGRAGHHQQDHAEGTGQDAVLEIVGNGVLVRGKQDHVRLAADGQTDHPVDAQRSRQRKRDREMSSTKKGNNYYFGLKVHTGVDADSGLVHSLEITTAKVADGNMIDALIHGEEAIVLGDRAYTRNDRNLTAQRQPEEPVWGMPFKRKSGEELPAEHAVLNRILASLRAKVEHPFRIVKRQFGYTKTRYRGLFKNAQQLYLLFALANLYHVRKVLMPIMG